MSNRLPTPPRELGKAGRETWRAILADYELSGADLLVLRQICAMADQIESLRPMLELGPFIKDPNTGLPRPNPAMVQYRLMTDSMSKKMASIRVIGDVASDEPGRPQKHSGFRGYQQGQLRAVK
jgi:hypothetical protein